MEKKQHAVAILILSNILLSLACKCPPCPPPKGKPSCQPTKPPHHPPPVSPPPKRTPHHPPPPPRRYPPPISPPPPRTPRHPPISPPPSPPSPTPRYPPPPPQTPRYPPPISPPLPAPPPSGRCPIDALQLGACVDVLSSLVHIVIGSDLKRQCCPIIQGLAGLDAAVCFCSVIRAKLLNLTLILPIALQVILGCGQSVPTGFLCPPMV